MSALAWLTAPGLPVWAGVSLLHPRLRRDWQQRFGSRVPAVHAGCTWIAASSVGEVHAALVLAAHLGEPCLVTSDTDTGLEAAARLPQDSVVLSRRPVDHPWTLAPLLAEAQPSRLVWVEGCYWPWLAAEARRLGIPQIRVNARPGRGTEWWLRWGVPPHRIVARDAASRDWLARRTEVPTVVGGDLKASRLPEPESWSWSREFGILGCGRAGDAERVLVAGPQWAWCLAPRHLADVDETVLAARRHGRTPVRWSQLRHGDVPETCDTVVLDRMGPLAGLYPHARFAVIGGTFDPQIGGHAPWEAAAAGIPIVAGPEVAAQGTAFADVGATLVDGPNLKAVLAGPLSASRPGSSKAGVETAKAVASVPPGRPSASPRPWARPAAVGFSVGQALWHEAYDRGWRRVHRVQRPVISVGSTNSRGPGKTSTVAWLGQLLMERGHRVGVACRGVGRARRLGPACAVSDRTPEAESLGDEGALLARRGLLVAACPDRVRAAEALVERGVDVVLLDDGLQHRMLHRDLDLGVVDARFLTARGALPMGEAREARWCPTRVDGLIVHHGDRIPPTDVPCVFMRRVPGAWHRGEGACEPPTGPVVAFAGIGRPADFIADLEVDVAEWVRIRDHQRLGPRDWSRLLKRAAGRPLVCTEKDAVRLRPEWRSQVWWRGIELTSTPVPEAWFDGL